MSQNLPFSIPMSAPAYGPPPYAYRDCPQLIVVFRSSADSLRQLLPTPVVPNPDDIAFLMIGTMNTDEFGTYREAIVAVPSAVGEHIGNFVVFHYVEGDTPMVAGRELMGWPKRAADIDWGESSGVVDATCSRAGEALVEARAELAGPADASQLTLSPTWLNLKVIPSVRADAPPDVAQITAMTLTDVRVSEAMVGAASLQLHSTATDPLGRLVVDEVVAAFFCRLSFDLPFGQVAHDYLLPALPAAREVSLA
jgi:acetoacetate decarboxylase